MNASQLTPYVCPRLRSSKNDRVEAGSNKRSGCMTADVSGSASLATLILSPSEENRTTSLSVAQVAVTFSARIGSLTVPPFMPRTHGINVKGLRQLADGLTGT